MLSRKKIATVLTVLYIRLLTSLHLVCAFVDVFLTRNTFSSFFTSPFNSFLQVCPSRYFTCKTGDVICVAQEVRCDCSPDCQDGSDETSDWASCSEQMLFYCERNVGNCKFIQTHDCHFYAPNFEKKWMAILLWVFSCVRAFVCSK